jgi:Transposase DDE domain
VGEVRAVWRTGVWRLQIVKRSDTAGFEVLPKRWIVERTFAWISRNRRLARDFERYATTVAAFVRLVFAPDLHLALPRNDAQKFVFRSALRPNRISFSHGQGPKRT